MPPTVWETSRLIPARAGKTSSAAPNATPTTAHPRAGGENYEAGEDIGKWEGSSPRGRGKPGEARIVRSYPRLIPARAGKTAARACFQAARPAHPRAGGENMMKLMGLATTDGSSPRGRGKRLVLPRDQNVAGLIPARAGKTVWFGASGCECGAHPRAGGENG